MTLTFDMNNIKRKARGRKKGRFLGAIFGLLFFLPGMLIMGWGFYDFAHYVKIQTWHAVPGYIHSAELEKSTGSDSGTMYKATASYTYSYEGRTYNGARASLYDDGFDNIGSFQQDTARQLEYRMEKGGHSDVYINPDNPSESILIRDFRWGFFIFKFLFGLIFAGVGGVVIYASLSKSKVRENALAGESNAPWLDNPKWQTPEILSDAKGAVWGAALFAVFWNAISFPVAFMVTPEVQNGEYAAAIAYLFPLAGLGLVYMAVKTYLEYRRFGKTVFTMDPFPGAIDGQVGGTIDLKTRLPQDTQYKVQLMNLYSYVSGSGKNRSRREKVLWEKTIVAYAEPYMEGTRLIFAIDVPSGDVQPSDALRDSSSYHLWRINLSSDIPGVDLDRNFVIPVYATGERSRRISGRVAENMVEMDTDYNKELLTRHLPLKQGVQGYELYFPYFRSLLNGFGGIIFSAIFLGVAYFTWSQGDAPIIFPIIFGFFGGLILGFSFYAMTNSLRVYLDGVYLYSIRKWLGVFRFEKSLLISDIASVGVKNTSSQTTGKKHTTYYKIIATDRAGKKIILAEGLPGRSVAEYAVKELIKTYNLKTD